ncbi:MAG: DciA family protein [Ilumatobacteraceae bacterium]
MTAGRADEPIHLGDSLQEVMRSMRDEDRRTPTKVAAIGGVFGRWNEAVGAHVAEHVQPVSLDGTTLVVSVADPTWATQVRFLERTVCERLAAVAGVTVERLEIRVSGRRGEARGGSTRR